MENVNGPTLPQLQRTAFDMLRPYLHVLRASGITEGALRLASEQVYRLYARTPARGVWLSRACFLQLAEILRVWARDPEFIDQTGEPMRLRLIGTRRDASSFAHLLKKARVSIEARSALEHLQALGSLQRCDRGRRVRLVSNVLVGVMGNRFLAVPILDSVRRFAETIEHNTCEKRSAADGRMHRWVGCASVDARRLGEIEHLARSSGEALLDALDERLFACTRKDTKERPLYGVGLYVFVDHARKASGRRTRERCASA